MHGRGGSAGGPFDTRRRKDEVEEREGELHGQVEENEPAALTRTDSLPADGSSNARAQLVVAAFAVAHRADGGGCDGYPYDFFDYMVLYNEVRGRVVRRNQAGPLRMVGVQLGIQGSASLDRRARTDGWGALLPRRFGRPRLPKKDDMTRTELGWVGAAKYDRDGRYDVFAITRSSSWPTPFFSRPKWSCTTEAEANSASAR